MPRHNLGAQDHPVPGGIEPNPAYVCRFAPSPTGDLHHGSLVTAMASLLDARANQGRWLVRIEDADLTRSSQQAVHQILAALEAFGFTWDGEIVAQSQRGEKYERALKSLQEGNLV